MRHSKGFATCAYITLVRLTMVCIVLVMITLACGIGPKKWQDCHKAAALEITPKGACVIYSAITTQARKHWKDGMTPNAVRLNGATLAKLAEEFPSLYVKGKTSYGARVDSIELPTGKIRVIEDKSMPDDAVIVTVAIPTYVEYLMRGYYDENGDLSAE